MSRLVVNRIEDIAGTNPVDVADINKAESVSYLPAGTGAVATDVQNKLREFVSVKDFGAAVYVRQWAKCIRRLPACGCSDSMTHTPIALAIQLCTWLSGFSLWAGAAAEM